jgi:hypothetical protein
MNAMTDFLRHKQSVVVTLYCRNFDVDSENKDFVNSAFEKQSLGIARDLKMPKSCSKHIYMFFGFTSQHRLMDVMYYLILLADAISFSETFHLILDIFKLLFDL